MALPTIRWAVGIGGGGEVEGDAEVDAGGRGEVAADASLEGVVDGADLYVGMPELAVILFIALIIGAGRIAIARQSVEAAASCVATLEAQLDHLEHFRPGKPTPTHRFEGVAA